MVTIARYLLKSIFINDTRRYNSKKIQSYLKKTFRQRANQIIQEKGGLSEFYRDFKKGFMKTCKRVH